MDNSTRTLLSVLQPTTTTQKDRFVSHQDRGLGINFNTYLTVLSINLVHRFPDVGEMDQIPYDEIQKIAGFCIACSTVALETWNKVNEGRYINAPPERKVG